VCEVFTCARCSRVRDSRMCVQESSLVFPRIDKGRRTMWLVGPHGSWENARRTVGRVGPPLPRPLRCCEQVVLTRDSSLQP
jgi:hypothetical protein